MVKVLIISGSPRKNGNNEKAIKFAFDLLDDYEIDIFFLSEKKVAPCKACDYCKKHGKCVIKDDMQEIYKKAVDADAIIVSSPVYFGTVSSQLKAVFDRSRILRYGFELKNKIGAAIACGRSRNGGQETTIQAIHNWMHIHGMKVLGDCNHYGGTVVDEFENDEDGKKTIKSMIGFVKENLESDISTN